METKRRQTALLGVLGVLVVVWAYVTYGRSTGPAAGVVVAQNAPRSAFNAATATPPDVHTEALSAERPRPGAADRDLFKFKPKYVPPPPRPAAPQPVAIVPPGPPPPPPIPPIPLKFIGVLEPNAGQRIAILSDGRGAPIYGKEGEALLGQYRILRIGAESIELEYIDGKGRQAIRLSGS